MDGYKGGRSDYATEGELNDQEHKGPSFLPPLPCSSEQLCNNGSSEFTPHFLVAAAAASAQAEAARSAIRLLHSSSSAASSSSSMLQASFSMSPAPPLPYLEYTTPFPMSLGSRFINPNTRTAGDLNGKNHGHSDELGRVRCCWAILSTMSERLDFLYVDPVFSRHLSSKSNDILGSSFFDYIHPAEEERTRVDMKNIIGSRTLFGSVTRCRYSRLSRIQSMLQKDGIAEEASEESYIPIDIVVNWIGEDMALCFFHAIIDESAQDSDEMNKTDWSNWCGMKQDSFDSHECQFIWKYIQSHRSLTSTTTGPRYVFQVLSTVSSASTPQVFFSWPPPRLFATPTNDALTASAINFADGSYFVDDFARLAQGVDQLILKKELSDANTSCTRRFRAKHTLTTDGMIRSVESVLIPYGSIVLACFSVIYAQMLPGSAAADFTTFAAKSNNGSSSYSSFNKGHDTESIAGAKYKNGSSVQASLNSLIDASISLSKGKSHDQFMQGGNFKAKQEGGSSDAGGSVGTLAAVAAAAAAQSKICASCGTSNSPEWRKGPDGTKSLCNACGLRYSRTISRMKKKEERAIIAAEVAANGGIIPPHLRKRLGDDSRKNKKIKTGKKNSNEAEADALTSTDPALPNTADIDTDDRNGGETATD